MVIGVLRLSIRFHGNSSLKGKQSKINKLKTQVRNKFNISIADISEDETDVELADIGMAIVNNDGSYVNKILDHVINEVESLCIGDLLKHEFEIINV